MDSETIDTALLIGNEAAAKQFGISAAEISQKLVRVPTWFTKTLELLARRIKEIKGLQGAC